MNINFGSTAPIQFDLPKGIIAQIEKASNNEESIAKQLDKFIYQINHNTSLPQTHNSVTQGNYTEALDAISITTDIPNEQLGNEVNILKKIAQWLDENVLKKSTIPLNRNSFSEMITPEKIGAFAQNRITAETTYFTIQKAKD